MRLNLPITYAEKTHEGAPAARMTPIQALERSVMSCLLWEAEYYEDGEAIADRISRLAADIPLRDLALLATRARKESHLRHVPLLLLSVLAERGRNGVFPVADTLGEVISRADELGEFLVVDATRRKIPLDQLKRAATAQVREGLGIALRKFDRYQLGKYNRAGTVTLRDVIRLAHPKPRDKAQADLWKAVLDGTLEAPDTWEVNLSGGADPRETWTRLINEGRLPYFALLRNLRNMDKVAVSPMLISSAILARKGADRILPFRFVAAARACPRFEPALDQALADVISEMPVLPGVTAVLVDVSDSMNAKLSGKSDLTRMDAAAALASIIPGTRRVFTFSNAVMEVPPRFGMAGVDVIKGSQRHAGTYLGETVKLVNEAGGFDRIIVITDEQAATPVPAPTVPLSYMINVASAKNGVGYGPWKHIDGFSENVIRWISAMESADRDR